MSNPIYPQGYSHWLAKRLPALRTETLATCENCAMVRPAGLTRDPSPFLNHLKCCTYFPFLPNFSLGSLSETDLAKPEPRGVFLPVGLYPAMPEQNRIRSFGRDGFGRKSELLCPFFDVAGNQCSIWDSRPGVCTSYFCKSDQGQKGLDFWKSVESYLNHFEWQLASKVIAKMDLDENVLSYCQAALSPDTEEDERDIFIALAWGNWASKKKEFYQETRRLALQVSSEEITGLLEPEFLSLEQKINS
jgi:Fe-S-cluster containining protein